MKRFYYFLLCLLVFPSMIVFAQKRNKLKIVTPAYTYVDSLGGIYELRLKALTEQYKNDYARNWDTYDIPVSFNPYYLNLLTPVFLQQKSLRVLFSLHSDSLLNVQNSFHPLKDDLIRLNQSYLQLSNLYANNPLQVKHTEQELNNVGGLLAKEKKWTESKATLTKPEQSKVIAPTPVIETPDLVVQKPNFWTFSGNYTIQFMQNYISENWYKGGESNLSTLAGLMLKANYNNKQQLIFDNTLEVKLGFRSSPSDKVHKYKTHTDVLRLVNKLGLKASKHWYYTIMLQSWTQVYKGYKSNNEKVFSDFMTPFQSVFSLGMNYKLDTKKFKLSADLSPLALNYTYVKLKELGPSFGVKQDQRMNLDFGSTLTATAQWQIAKQVRWQSRLYAFTNYEKVQAEWENTFSFYFNKYLSSKLFLYPRFDDGVKRNTKDPSYLQLNEWFSLGLDFEF